MFKVLQIISFKVVEINGSSTLVPICHHTNANLFDQSILLFVSFLFIYNVYIHIFLQFRIILLDEFYALPPPLKQMCLNISMTGLQLGIVGCTLCSFVSLTGELDL